MQLPSRLIVTRLFTSQAKHICDVFGEVGGGDFSVVDSAVHDLSKTNLEIFHPTQPPLSA